MSNQLADGLFDELREAISLAPDYVMVYREYGRVFQECLNRRLMDVPLVFAGTFSKTDYLLKECKAPAVTIAHTNELRVRLRQRNSLSEDILKDCWQIDLRYLCEFISLVFSVKTPSDLCVNVNGNVNGNGDIFKGKVINDYVRVIVTEWDDTFVYGKASNSIADETQKICYAKDNKYYNFDWSYLNKMFYPGEQINLIRPRQTDGVVYPELIIINPDYLVDISSVARCFTNYADSPMVNILNRLSPQQTTEAILLGNLAGQMLDEELHGVLENRKYPDIISDFFSHNAVSILTTDIGDTFHTEARRQKVNIHKAMSETLPKNVSRFNINEGMVEPSFFSEMLGLQGRMDYLQSDLRVLLEQKSGKGAFPFDGFHVPHHKTDHYVQLLLYMLLIRYNFHDVYIGNNKELHAFLLYTKYEESLLALGFSPQLIFEALRIRNGIAWMDVYYIATNGYRFLTQLTPDSLNKKNASGSLWENYQKRQIADILQPIHHATPLEREYYLRMLSFVSMEHLLSKMGNKTKEGSGFAAKWHDSLDEKRQAGNIYDSLVLCSPSVAEERDIEDVTFRFTETTENNMSNFRRGDIVILYQYEKGCEPDVRAALVYRGTIKEIRTDEIELRLRAPQMDASNFLRHPDKPWAIEHDFMESSYNGLYRGIHAFLSAPKERRDLLLMQREPRIDTSLSLRGDYGAFNDMMLRVRQSQDLFLIIGPPGTGKTSFGMLNTLKEELLSPDSNVLILSYTNRAVDEICSKLKDADISFLRIGSMLSCADDYKVDMLASRTDGITNVGQLRRLISGTRVFVGTTTSYNASINLFRVKSFSLAIIDEASQILEPHLLGLLSAHNDGVPAIGRIVMIGDHKQLPAVVQQTPRESAVDNPLLKAIHLTNCRNSLFERLLNRYGDDPRVTYQLNRQGRMHHEVALFPNEAFYAGKLDEVPLPHQRVALPKEKSNDNLVDVILRNRRVTFVSASRPDHSTSDKVNKVEAEIIANMVVKIYELRKEHFDVSTTVGVIVPYRNQIATIRDLIAEYDIPGLRDITIDTVERFQGSQRDYIIYGFTVQKPYQLDFLTNNVFTDTDGSVIDRKLNVAMTRAREHLIMVGNIGLLSLDPIFSRLITYLRDSGNVV
ncbi:MAG: AAA family ATPase [Prevotella sp.]|nr:AAA family ATPase [Prevotella sp.]